MPEVSVIVPVYKVENTLDACVESILGQRFTDLELILVDDGSPDNCGAMCDAWAKKDGRVVVIHQPNKGLAGARNTGLEHRRARYVAFVDSDDSLPKNALELLYTKAVEHDFDIVTAGATLIYPKHRRNWTCPAFDALSPAGLAPYIQSYFFSMLAIIHPAGKLLRGALIDEFGLRFDPALKISEDTDFYCRLFAHAQKVANLDVPLYNYMKRAERYTITSRPRLDGVENARIIKEGIVQMLRALGFAQQANAYEADPARMSGYGIYFNQLNHAGLRISFGEHRRRLGALLNNAVAYGVVLKRTANPEGQASGLAAKISHFLAKRRWSFWLTVFIRLKSWAIRRRDAKWMPPE